MVSNEEDDAVNLHISNTDVRFLSDAERTSNHFLLVLVYWIHCMWTHRMRSQRMRSQRMRPQSTQTICAQTRL